MLLPCEAALRWAASRRRPRFEQELARRAHDAANQREATATTLPDQTALVDFIRGERLLGFVAPAYLQGKLANAYRQLGQHRRAAAAFRLALEDKDGGAAFPLALGLADSLYELGEDREAERVYRQALDEEHAPPRACLHLSRLIRRRGGSPDEAEAYLRRSVEQSPDPHARCELASLLAERNKVDEADWQLQLCREALGAATMNDDLRAVVEEQLAAAERAVEEARARPVSEPEPEPAPRRA